MKYLNSRSCKQVKEILLQQPDSYALRALPYPDIPDLRLLFFLWTAERFHAKWSRPWSGVGTACSGSARRTAMCLFVDGTDSMGPIHREERLDTSTKDS